MIQRISAPRWGCNLFGSLEDAERCALDVLRPGSHYYIWRTVDGLYDWSAIPDRLVPWLEQATLVKTTAGSHSEEHTES